MPTPSLSQPHPAGGVGALSGSSRPSGATLARAAGAFGEVREPELIGLEPPPIRRDRLVQGWVVTSMTSRAGDAAFVVGLTWTAIHHLPTAVAGFVVTAELVPQAALSVVGGHIADHCNTRRVLRWGWAGRIAVLLAALIAWHSLAPRWVVLFGIAVGFGVVAGLTIPASATYTRQLVRSGDLATVGGWSQIGLRLATLVGAPIGAAAVSRGGLPLVIVIDAATFALAIAVVTYWMRPRYRLPRTVGQPWRSAIADGLTYLRRSSGPRNLVIGLLGLNTFVTPMIGIGLALRAQESHWGAPWVGYAEAASAAAAIAGCVIGIRWQGRRLAQRSFSILLLEGVGIALAGLPHQGFLLVGMIVIGLTAGCASVWLGATFVRVIDPGYLGRVSSLAQLGDLTLVPLATPVFAITAGATSSSVAALVFGVGMCVLCLSILARPAIRSLP